MSEVPEAVIDEILDLLRGDRKIAAIRAYRMASGSSLREAKEFIEQLTRRLEQESPEFLRPASTPAGCLRSAGLLTVVLTGLAIALRGLP